MTFKPLNHKDYDKLFAQAVSLTDAMIQQRAEDCFRHGVSTELLEGQGIVPVISSQQHYDESSFWQTYLQKRLDGMTHEEIRQANEAYNRA
ncbi:MAG: hypothetical protein CL581_10960 [Alteromonadaceae bacterium]|nr:hypothetical protein [Alteromonadaceae bacterium]MAA65282.1 hypothetical protein [Alteromonadaceae bacterium]